MRHRTLAATAAAALVLGGLVAVTNAPTAEATGGWRSFGGTGFGAIPDGIGCSPSPGAPLDIIFDVTGVPAGQLADVRIGGLEIAHTYVGDLSATLYAPASVAAQTVFARTGTTTAGGAGDSSDLAGPYTFTDRATPDAGGWWQAAALVLNAETIPAGDFFATTPGGSTAGGAPISLTGPFSGLADANGWWTLRFTDGCNLDTGSVSAATLDLRIASERCALEQSEVSFQEASLTAATTAAGAAQVAATASAAKLVSAKKAVTKAKKAARKAKSAKAKSRAKAKLAKATVAKVRAQGAKTTAGARLTAANAALTAAQTGLARSQSALTACQQE